MTAPSKTSAEARLARIKAWQTRNPDRHRAASRRYDLRHREEVIARNKAYKQRWRALDRLNRYAAGLIPGANHNAQWSAGEDKELLGSTLPSTKLAWILGRTPAAVRNRRYNLKHNHK